MFLSKLKSDTTRISGTCVIVIKVSGFLVMTGLLQKHGHRHLISFHLIRHFSQLVLWYNHKNYVCVYLWFIYGQQLGICLYLQRVFWGIHPCGDVYSLNLNYTFFVDLTLVLFLSSNRLNTIMDSDRVLLMQAGKVVEFDSPSALCNKETQFFRNFYKEETN